MIIGWEENYNIDRARYAMKVGRTVRIGGKVRNNLKDLPIDNHAVMQEQNYWKGQKQKFRKKIKSYLLH